MGGLRSDSRSSVASLPQPMDHNFYGDVYVCTSREDAKQSVTDPAERRNYAKAHYVRAYLVAGSKIRAISIPFVPSLTLRTANYFITMSFLFEMTRLWQTFSKFHGSKGNLKPFTTYSSVDIRP